MSLLPVRPPLPVQLEPLCKRGPSGGVVRAALNRQGGCGDSLVEAVTLGIRCGKGVERTGTRSLPDEALGQRYCPGSVAQGRQTPPLPAPGAANGLTGVWFVDESSGWTVSSYREILHSANGGIWQLQETGTSAGFRDVHFVDTNHGWAAGFAFPDIPVLLHTENGGNVLLPESPFADGFESGSLAGWSTAVGAR